MEIRILGPLEVSDDARTVNVSGAKRRLLLTMLAVGAPHAVGIERLVEALWGDRATEASGQNLQTYVYQLRKLLGADVVETQPSGYALALAPEQIDALRFADLIDEARRESSSESRRERLANALALWRGTPLAEFPDVPALAAEATRLEHLRLAALEERIDSDLELGNHGAVVPELQSLVAQYPLRERFWAQLMTGLYRGDRQAEALRAYSVLREHLTETLGIDPSPALTQLEHQILEQDPALLVPAPTAAALVPPRPSSDSVGESSAVHAAFLFSDMEGSTRRWEAEPEVMNAALAEHDRILRTEFEARGGRVFTTAGDSFAVTFPTAGDAIEAALAAQLALADADWSAVGGVAVRMGIHVGSAYRGDGDYFGPTLNRAARLHAAGYGGQVLLSAAAVAGGDLELPSGASLVDLGEHRLRDLGQPERIYQLAHPDLRAEFPPLKAEARAAEESLFVGRNGEVDRLGRRIERLRTNARGGVVMLIGEPGIGKTRTATRVTATARRDGVQVLWGRCMDGPWARPYGPFADAITSYVESSGETFDLALRSWAPVLGQLLLREDFPFEPDLPVAQKTDQADAGEQRVRVFAAVSGFFASLAESAPLLVVLDDLHWADEATIALLRYVARAASSHRVLILGTFRDGEVGSSHPLADVLGTLPRETDYERVRLRGLSARDVAELAHSMLGADLSPEILAAVADDTGGNPFFVQQVLSQLQSELRGSGSVPENFSVPATVLDVVDHRVARLPEVAQRFLRTAAVFDGDFEFAVVAMVAGLSEDDALDALDSALDSQLVDPSERLDAYRFTHTLARQALAAALNPSRLVRAHRRAAEALLETARMPLDPTRAGEIAAHFHRSASLPGSEQGVEPALIAATHAEATGANQEAAAYLRVALDLMHPDDANYPDVLGRLGCNLARAANDDGHVVETMDRAIDLIARVHGSERAAEYGLAAVEAIYTGMTGYDPQFFEKCVSYCGDRRDETWAALFVMYMEMARPFGTAPGASPRSDPDFIRASEILLETRRLNLSSAVMTACRGSRRRAADSRLAFCAALCSRRSATGARSTRCRGGSDAAGRPASFVGAEPVVCGDGAHGPR